jgi:hypothetical protein
VLTDKYRKERNSRFFPALKENPCWEIYKFLTIPLTAESAEILRRERREELHIKNLCVLGASRRKP